MASRKKHRALNPFAQQPFPTTHTADPHRCFYSGLARVAIAPSFRSLRQPYLFHVRLGNTPQRCSDIQCVQQLGTVSPLWAYWKLFQYSEFSGGVSENVRFSVFFILRLHYCAGGLLLSPSGGLLSCGLSHLAHLFLHSHNLPFQLQTEARSWNRFMLPS